MIELSRSEVEAYYSATLPDMVQRGKQWRGRCPVHNGNGLNFSVDSETGRSYCHSECGRGWHIPALEMELTGTGYVQACRTIANIIGRNVLVASPTIRPRYTDDTLASAELFRTGLLWRIDRALKTTKAELYGPGHKQAAVATRKLTKHLDWVRSWTLYQVAETAGRIDYRLVRECLEEARNAQIELASVIWMAAPSQNEAP